MKFVIVILLLLSLSTLIFDTVCETKEQNHENPVPRRLQREEAALPKNKTDKRIDEARRYKMMTFDYLADHHRNPFDDFKLGVDAVELVWSFVNKLPKSWSAPSSSAVTTQRKRNLQRQKKLWKMK